MLQRPGEAGEESRNQAVAPSGYDKQLVSFQSLERFFDDILRRHPEVFGYGVAIHSNNVVEFRIGESGTQSLDAHGRLNASEFEVETFGESVDPGFGCRVGYIVRSSKESGNRRNIDDISFLPFYHTFERSVGESLNGENMKTVHSVLFFRICLMESARYAEAGIIHQKFESRFGRNNALYLKQV